MNKHLMVPNGKNLFGFEIFDEIFKDFDFFLRESPTVKELYSVSFPPANVYIKQESKDLVFEFALAGYSQDDIDISFEGDKMFLEITKTSKEDSKDYYLHRGIKMSSQKRWYFVPLSKYKVEDAEAKFENGILTVNVPAKEEAKPRKIKINL